MILLSIVTTVKNGHAALGATMDSVLKQKVVGEVEYVVIDAKSSDGTADLIFTTPNIDHAISEPDSGISDGFNKGIRFAQGEYIWFVNCGDSLLEGAVEKVLPILREGTADVVYGDMILDHGSQKRYFKSDHRKLERCMSIAHPATLVRRRIFDELGIFRCDLKIAMDYELLLKAISKNKRFVKIEAPLTLMSSGGVSDKFWMKSLLESHRVRMETGRSRWISTFFFARSVVSSVISRLRLSLGGWV